MKAEINKKALVVGGGISGLSLARFWRARGALVTAIDSRETPPAAAQFKAELPEVSLRHCSISSLSESELAAFDLIAAGPGIAPREIRAPADKIVGDAECFFNAVCDMPRRPFLIAVTGTNGKSTTVALLAHLCEIAGRRAAAIGNIGYPLLDALAEWTKGGGSPPDVAAVELSSFQLEILRPGFALGADAACVLNVGEDHLDRHGDLASYARIKARIYGGAKDCVVNRGDAFISSAAIGEKARGFAAKRKNAQAGDWFADEDRRGVFLSNDKEKFYAADFSPPLRSQLQSALAALALLSPLGLDADALSRGLAGFAGLPHRQQTLGERGGAFLWMNDSKATNVGAACYALANVAADGRRAVLIAGGEAKGQNFYPLARAASGRVRLAVLLGCDADKLQAAFAAEGVATKRAATMEEAVHIAAAAARRGDCVLLSPACASFDMFADYRARGDAFCRAARAYLCDDAAVV